MTVHLSPDDLRVLDDGPRVQDLRLAEALGFERPRAVRQLIERNIKELEDYGVICATVAQNPEGNLPHGVAKSEEVWDTASQTHPDTDEPAKRGRGRPGREYWLNEEQALLLSMFARTDNAAAVRRMLIGAFMEWRRQHRRESIRPPEAERILLPPPSVDTPFHLQPPLPSSLRELEEDPVPSDTMVKLAKIRTAERLFGRRAAARIWQEVGFTVYPEAEHAFRRTRLDEGRACLAWLLGQEAGESYPLVRGMVELAEENGEGAMEARRHLIRLGLKFFSGGLFISNSHPWLMRVFGDTEWDAGRHAEALRRLPGARPERTYIGDQQQRGTLVPLSLIDEPQVP
ncbi:hypothetical protein GGQ86_000361 [Xanthobacter flavus]|uniref:Uncharacterized protein n=1 Tax=Xanthobacter flavus TaxID=281 RepID=A0A9W6CUN6_XANFL|nr:hypothetical protein [Xanthobacter flavus]MDR6331914.1 hypothetical protein [Xanthobacter flavus]GLI25674.1 hypothetical protein XFLAVUS301_53480 [Xanthobacter flavus]